MLQHYFLPVYSLELLNCCNSSHLNLYKYKKFFDH